MTNQRRVLYRHESLGAGVYTDRLDPVLVGRARQVIALKGYSLFANVYNTTPAAGNGNQILVSLNASARDADNDFDSINELAAVGSTAWDVGHSPSQLVDLIYWESEIGAQTAGTDGWTFQQPWIACDLLLPELGVFMGQLNADAVRISWGVTIEYQWKTVDVGEIAEVNLAWGRDPNDFERGY